jgi:hypothetical protein
MVISGSAWGDTGGAKSNTLKQYSLFLLNVFFFTMLNVFLITQFYISKF